jgi:NADP-dependent 3-hydroxy acid dehydrogenase YdfG
MAPSRLRYVSNVTGVAAGSSGVADQTNRALERAGEALLAGARRGRDRLPARRL